LELENQRLIEENAETKEELEVKNVQLQDQSDQIAYNEE